MRLFLLLMRLYPRDFRREYGEEMERDVAERGAWKEATWDILRTAPREHLDQLRATLQQASRSLCRTPGFTLVALATLAAGIGLNTAIFSIVYGILLKPLPYPEPHRLFVVREALPNQLIRNTLGPDFGSWRAESKTAQTVAGYTGWNPLYAGPDGAEPVTAAQVSPELMGMLGVRPEWGRLLNAQDDRPGAPAVALVSHRFWREKMGSRHGGRIELDTVAREVVGVLPPEFQFPARTAVWVPFGEDFLAQRFSKTGILILDTLVRLKPGVTAEMAAAELTGIAVAGWNHPGVIGGYRNMIKGIRAELMPLADTISFSSRPQLLMLMGGVALVLLIACLNVANLFVARAASRTREVAVRLALGAGLGRIACHILSESLLLAGGGACLGAALAYFLLRLLLAIGGDTLPRTNEISIDGAVLGVTAVVSLATGLLFGLSPLLFVRRTAVIEALKDGARGGGDPALPKLRSALVASQLALSLMLLVGAGLLMRSFVSLRNVDPGFEPRGLLTLQTNFAPGGSPEATRNAMLEFYRQAFERLRALPGVTSVALAPELPVSGRFRNMAGLQVEGVSNERKLPRIGELYINTDYFAAMHIPIRSGRAFTEEDFGRQDRIIVNESLGRSYFGTTDVVGRRMRVFSDTAPWMTIVGVVADVRHIGLHADAAPEFYNLYTQRPRTQMNYALRVASGIDPKSLADPARNALRSISAGVGVHNIITMEDRIYGTLAQRRFQMWLLGAFALLAVGLAGIGVYGVVSYLVALRSHEIGVRMALGATAGNIVRLVMGHAWVLTSVGLAAGLLAAYGAGQAISKLLFAIEPTDPLAIGGAVAALLMVATLAAAIPARRAAALDPATTLRRE
jgi:predicted permease